MWIAGLYRTCAGMCTRKGVFVDISRERVPENGILGTYQAGRRGVAPRTAPYGSAIQPVGFLSMETGKFAL